MRIKRLSIVLVLILSCVARPGVSHATGFGVAPTEIDFAPDTHSAAVAITNSETTMKVMQVTIFAWNQVQGKDIQEKTSDVIAAPPIFTLGPLESQTIRLALTHRLPADRESSYRIVISEVPSALKMRNPSAQVSMAFSIPIFVVPSAVSAQRLQWHIDGHNPNAAAVTIYNPTNIHAKIENLTLRYHGTTVYSMGGGHEYVLAGQRMTFPVKLARPIGTAATEVAARINGSEQLFTASSEGQ